MPIGGCHRSGGASQQVSREKGAGPAVTGRRDGAWGALPPRALALVFTNEEMPTPDPKALKRAAQMAGATLGSMYFKNYVLLEVKYTKAFQCCKRHGMSVGPTTLPGTQSGQCAANGPGVCLRVPEWQLVFLSQRMAEGNRGPCTAQRLSARQRAVRAPPRSPAGSAAYKVVPPADRARLHRGRAEPVSHGHITQSFSKRNK